MLATVFTLVMSNVGATVLLVPLAVSIAVAAGGDPAIFALTVAIATSNSFLIPTHQVNALFLGPAAYRVVDFIKSGGAMTGLFLVVSLVCLGVGEAVDAIVTGEECITGEAITKWTPARVALLRTFEKEPRLLASVNHILQRRARSTG